MNLLEHAESHATKLGFSGPREYLRGAKSFLSEAIERGYQATYSSADNTIRVWDRATQRFASYEIENGKLIPRTFMKTGVNYFRNQLRNHAGQVSYDLKQLIK